MERDPGVCENRVRAIAATTASASTLPTAAPTAATTRVGTGTEASEEWQGIGAPVLLSTERPPAFRPSTTLGTEVVEGMMASRYVTVIGILGEPESGKTACLVSLYLLASNGLLEEWAFANSASLMGFEDIARGAREWNEGQPPEQLTLHTEMADDRQPGFLHLRLKRKSDGRRVDLALPDLPGEWTKELVKSARTDRLEFMRSAETVWLVVDGRALRDLPFRQGAITRLGQLLGRLEAMTEKSPPKVFVVVSHRDKGELAKSIRDRLTAEIGKHSLEAEIVEVAPFADEGGACKAGFGIEALLNASVIAAPEPLGFWAPTTPAPGKRAYLAYRRDR